MRSTHPDPAPDRPPGDDAVARHASWLVGWFRARGLLLDEAEDLAQECLLRLLRNRDGLRDPTAAPAWLVRTARDLLRRRPVKRRAGRLDGSERAAPSDESDAGEDSRVLAAVAELPEQLQQVVLARYTRGLGYDACAEVLGVPRSTVQSRLRRALRKLRAQLSRDKELRR
ncbi:MAG: RNA polymerase sigma factor [Planctomycetota bacterium]